MPFSCCEFRNRRLLAYCFNDRRGLVIRAGEREPTLFRWNLLAAIAAVALVFPGAAQARSDKSRVVQKALRQSVRVEVLVGGKVVRVASGVVVGTDDGISYVLTNEHVVQRDGLRGSAAFLVGAERPNRHRG